MNLANATVSRRELLAQPAAVLTGESKRLIIDRSVGPGRLGDAMRIAITGSWRDQDAAQWNLRNKASFFEAASALGAAFAKLGHRLVVATDSRHTADWAAVDGAVGAIPQRAVY